MDCVHVNVPPSSVVVCIDVMMSVYVHDGTNVMVVGFSGLNAGVVNSGYVFVTTSVSVIVIGTDV